MAESSKAHIAVLWATAVPINCAGNASRAVPCEGRSLQDVLITLGGADGGVDGVEWEGDATAGAVIA